MHDRTQTHPVYFISVTVGNRPSATGVCRLSVLKLSNVGVGAGEVRCGEEINAQNVTQRDPGLPTEKASEQQLSLDKYKKGILPLLQPFQKTAIH